MINLIIKGEIHTNVSSGIIRYKEFLIEKIEDQNENNSE